MTANKYLGCNSRAGILLKSIALDLAAAGLALIALSGVAAAQSNPAGSIEPDGTVIVPSFSLPPSLYMSDQAKAALPKKPSDPEEPMYRALEAGKAGELRQRIPEFM